MLIREIMSSPVIRVHPEESAAVAARMLEHYNVGILPVCNTDGRLCGLVTDRDLVTRCMAAGKSPALTQVKDIMTGKIISAKPEMELTTAARLMGREQIRRLPVVENGKLCGMISLGDLASREETGYEAGDALGEISAGLSHR